LATSGKSEDTDDTSQIYKLVPETKSAAPSSSLNERDIALIYVIRTAKLEVVKNIHWILFRFFSFVKK
jgi:hypothetical protein